MTCVNCTAPAIPEYCDMLCHSCNEQQQQAEEGGG